MYMGSFCSGAYIYGMVFGWEGGKGERMSKLGREQTEDAKEEDHQRE